MSSDYHAAVREKRKILRDIYGGMMTLKDVTKELGYGSTHSTYDWIAAAGVDAVRVGRSKKYETDMVAKAIVNGRGMV